VVAHLASLGFEARRGWQARQGHAQCDVEGTDWWIEVKRGKRCPIRAAMRQAEADTDGRPCLVLWRDDRQPWMVTLRLDDAVVLLDSGAGDG